MNKCSLQKIYILNPVFSNLTLTPRRRIMISFIITTGGFHCDYTTQICFLRKLSLALWLPETGKKFLVFVQIIFLAPSKPSQQKFKETSLKSPVTTLQYRASFYKCQHVYLAICGRVKADQFFLAVFHRFYHPAVSEI